MGKQLGRSWVTRAAPCLLVLAVACGAPKPGSDDFHPGTSTQRTEKPVPGFPGSDNVAIALGSECKPSGAPFLSTTDRINAQPRPRANTTDPFVLYWNICNQTAITAPATSYELALDRSIVDTQNPTVESFEPIGSPLSLPLPSLPACTCIIQEVGVNRAVPPEAAAQAQASGIIGAQFPTLTVAALVDQPPLVFGHRFSLRNAPVEIAESRETVK